MKTFYIWGKPGELPDTLVDRTKLSHPDEQQHELVHEFRAKDWGCAKAYYEGYVARWQESPDVFGDVRAFHKIFDLPHPDFLTRFPGVDCVKLRTRLIQEEVYKELGTALGLFRNLQTVSQADSDLHDEVLVDVADGIIDSIYVLAGAGVSFGIPLASAWREVQRSNMDKVGEDGVVNKRDDGKILKPPGWTPPDLWTVLGLRRNDERPDKT